MIFHKLDFYIRRYILLYYLPKFSLTLKKEDSQLVRRFCTTNFKYNKANFPKNQITVPKLSITYTCKVCNTKQVFLLFFI